MTIAAWPVARRTRLVHAFKPGDRSHSEAPFRTLRKHDWATPGVRIAPRAGSHLSGQLTMFSSLNVEAARLARRGDEVAATRVAAAATELEARPEFDRLSKILAELPLPVARDVIDGAVPDEAPPALLEALRAVGRATEMMWVQKLAGTKAADFLAG